MQLNDNFDFAGYVSRFNGKGRIRLEGALDDADALNVHQALERRTPWELQLVGAEGQPQAISRFELEQLPPDVIQSRLQDAAVRAQTGLSYLRLGFDLMAHSEPALKDISDLLKSEAFARLCEKLTGLSGLVLTQLSAVCYRNGDFFTRHTDTQTRLTPGERLRNVSGAFRARPSARSALRGRHIILVDDVVTTAATLNACAAALCDGGARIVSFVTFGRAPALGDRW